MGTNYIEYFYYCDRNSITQSDRDVGQTFTVGPVKASDRSTPVPVSLSSTVILTSTDPLFTVGTNSLLSVKSKAPNTKDEIIKFIVAHTTNTNSTVTSVANSSGNDAMFKIRQPTLVSGLLPPVKDVSQVLSSPNNFFSAGTKSPATEDMFSLAAKFSGLSLNSDQISAVKFEMQNKSISSVNKLQFSSTNQLVPTASTTSVEIARPRSTSVNKKVTSSPVDRVNDQQMMGSSMTAFKQFDNTTALKSDDINRQASLNIALRNVSTSSALAVRETDKNVPALAPVMTSSKSLSPTGMFAVSQTTSQLVSVGNISATTSQSLLGTFSYLLLLNVI